MLLKKVKSISMYILLVLIVATCTAYFGKRLIKPEEIIDTRLAI